MGVFHFMNGGSPITPPLPSMRSRHPAPALLPPQLIAPLLPLSILLSGPLRFSFSPHPVCPSPQLRANLLLVKNVTVHGVFWGSYMQHQPAVLRSSMDKVLQLVEGGRIAVHISSR